MLSGRKHVSFYKIFHARPDFVRRDVVQAEWFVKTAIIGAGLVRAGPAFENFRRRVKRTPPFVHGRAVEREGGYTADGREVCRARTVADEHSGLVNVREQFTDGLRAGGRFTMILPPRELIGIAGYPDDKIIFPQPRGHGMKIFQGPDAGGQAGAGMD